MFRTVAGGFTNMVAFHQKISVYETCSMFRYEKSRNRVKEGRISESCNIQDRASALRAEENEHGNRVPWLQHRRPWHAVRLMLRWRFGWLPAYTFDFPWLAQGAGALVL
jgi:hypothetical protein